MGQDLDSPKGEHRAGLYRGCALQSLLPSQGSARSQPAYDHPGIWYQEKRSSNFWKAPRMKSQFRLAASFHDGSSILPLPCGLGRGLLQKFQELFFTRQRGLRRLRSEAPRPR